MRRLLMANAASFDVVVLDLMLPDDNGLALCRWVRETSKLPVIASRLHAAATPAAPGSGSTSHATWPRGAQ